MTFSAQHTPLVYPDGSWLSFTPFTPLPALQETANNCSTRPAITRRHGYGMSKTIFSCILHLLCLSWILNIHNFFQLFSITRSFNTKICITFLISFHKRTTILTRECPIARWGEVMDPMAGRLGTYSACILHSKQRHSGSNTSVKIDRPWLLASVPVKIQCKTLLCMIGNSSTQVSKYSKQVAFVLPLKITGFYAENKTPYAHGRSNPYSLNKLELCNTKPGISYLFRN